MRLLIIDDSADDRHALRCALERAAAAGYYTFCEAESPALGLNAVESFAPDCILLDYRMPQGDGFDVLAQLKTVEGHVRCPVLMLTGQGDEQTAVRALKCGALDYVVKAGTFDGLHERVVAAYQQFQKDAAQREANERMQRELALRDELLSVMAHELKTPLTALSLNLSAAQNSVERLKQPGVESPDMSAAEKRLRRARTQVGRFERLISNLTDATQFNNCALKLYRAPVDLGQIARRVVGELFAFAAREGVNLSEGIDGKIVVYGDADRIEQVLNNLIGNAIKYGHRSPVHVSAAIDGDDGTICVSDGGPGIEASNQARIFERYERASSARRADSLGLGLYISRQLARAHGGDLTVRSQPEQGATFELRLPLCSQAHDCSNTPGKSHKQPFS